MRHIMELEDKRTGKYDEYEEELERRYGVSEDIDDITDGENYKKFTVTPGGSPVKNWYVGSNGALTTTQPTP